MDYLQKYNLSSQLIGCLIGLSRSTDGNKNRPTKLTHQALLTGMHMALPVSITDEKVICEQMEVIRSEKAKLVPRCTDCKKQCGRNHDFNIHELDTLEPNMKAMKKALLFGLLSLEPLLRNCTDQKLSDEAMDFLYRGFFYVGNDCKLELIIDLLSQLAVIFQNAACYLHCTAKDK